MEARESEPPSNRGLLRVLAVASSWGFAFAAFYLLPKYLEQALGARPAEIGVVMGSFGWATVAVAPLAARLIARRSRPTVFALGALLTAATSLGFLAVDHVGPLLLALRVVQAYAHAIVFTAVSIAVAELAPPERLSQHLGFAGASMLVMNAAAPALLEPLAASAGWPAVFGVSAAAAVLAAVLALRVPTTGSDRPTGRPIGIRDVLRTRMGRDFAAVSAISGLGFGAVFAFEPTLALSLGREHVSGFFVGFAAGAIVVRLGLGSLPDRVGRRAVAIATFALYAVSVLALTIVPASLLEVVGVSFGVAHGLFYPSINALVLAAAPPSSRVGILTTFTAAFYLGFAGPTLLGLLADAFGLRAVFLLVGTAIACGVALLAGSQSFVAAPRAREPGPPALDPLVVANTQSLGTAAGG